jgi:hypothetical protein
MRLSSGRCAPRLVLPDEAGARRPFFCGAVDPTHAYLGFERLLYSNLVETADKHCHIQPIVALAFTCEDRPTSDQALWRKVRRYRWRMS